MSAAIAFDRVSKRFVLQREKPRSFQDLALSLLRRQSAPREVFWALRNVSLEVERGQMLGLIGPNGAGKSTILKLMTRILEPTSGRVAVNGRVAALLELGAGFHPDLTGRENVFLNGSLLGFNRRQMQERLDSIIAFAGIERFIDVPVRHYSSGMYMRLGFAIAVHSEPDILITDEVLAVGDEEFQNRCLERMSRFRDAGVTIILVSHALPTVRRLCDRVLWLHQGAIVMDGEPDTVVDSYLADVEASGQAAPQEAEPARRQATVVDGLADVRLTGAQLLAGDGSARWAMTAGEPMRLRVHYQARKGTPEAALVVELHDADDQALIASYNSCVAGRALHMTAGTGYVELDDIAWPLRRGQYLISLALFNRPDAPAWANASDLQHKAYTLAVKSELSSPQRRWGTGQALLESLLLVGPSGRAGADIATGETLRIRLRCIKVDAAVCDPVARVQIFRAGDGLLCHATNTDRAGVRLGALDQPSDVWLVYDHLDLLEGEYVVSAGLWPSEDARRPFDWHDGAYRFRVHSERRHGGGLAALAHRWQLGD